MAAANIVDLPDDASWEKLIEKSGVPVVVEFYTPWCEPCKELEPVMQKLAKEFPTVSFYRYNMDKMDYLANKLDITGVPTTLLVRPAEIKGNAPFIIEQVRGYLTTDMFRPKLERLVDAKTPEKEPDGQSI